MDTYATKQAAMRSELASRFSTSTGAAMATVARRAPTAATFRENFMVNGREGRRRREEGEEAEWLERDVNLEKKKESRRWII